MAILIISVEELKKWIPESEKYTDENIKQRLDAIEILIRKYTNNNFQNRNIRFVAPSNGNILGGSSPFLKIGDTVQISESGVNDGLYIVESVKEGNTIINSELFKVSKNLVTKIEYPEAIKMGVINIMKWEINNRDKVGIKSETISRHSVTYFEQDKDNQVMGYPAALFGFLEAYKKARF